AGAIRRAGALGRRPAPAAHGKVRHGSGGPLGACSPSAAGHVEHAGASGLRARRARRAHVIAALRRGVLATDRTRSRLASPTAGASCAFLAASKAEGGSPAGAP